MDPPSRRAKRAVRALKKRANRRIEQTVNERNGRKLPHQLKISVEDAKRMLRGVVGSAIARAQELTGVEVYAFVVMSNHLHIVVQTPRKNLAKFMRHVKAFITQRVNQITGRRGDMWWRRYDAQPALCVASTCERIGYTIGNPVSANLVAHPEDWPSLNLAYGFADASLARVKALDDRDELTFEYFNATAWHDARMKDKVDLSKYFKTRVLVLKPLPEFAHLSRSEYKRAVHAWVKLSIERQQSKAKTEPLTLSELVDGREMPAHGRPLGTRKIIEKKFDEVPERTKRSKRPYAFGTREAVGEYAATMSDVEESYTLASRDFRDGNRDAVFPSGTYPPLLPALE